MSQSKGNYVGLAEAPEEQFGKAMRIPDALLGQWYRLVMDDDDVAGRRSARRRSSRSRGFIVTRSHGEDAAQAAEAHFTRVVREGRAPDEVPEAALPDDDPVHLPSLLVDALGIGTTSEARRLIEQRGGQAERRGRDGARSAARAARRGARSRRESAATCGFLRRSRSFATMPRRLARGCKKPANDTGDPSSQKIRPTYHLARGAFGVNRRLFSGPQQRVWSLKTQQRETSRLFGWSLRGRAEEFLKPVVSWLHRGHDFELKLTLNQLPTLPDRHSAGRLTRKRIFTESLILAQDERWRRA